MQGAALAEGYTALSTVIARKVSQCSKTWPGAHAFAAFTSVIQTLLKKGAPSTVVEALADLFRAPRGESAPA